MARSTCCVCDRPVEHVDIYVLVGSDGDITRKYKVFGVCSQHCDESADVHRYGGLYEVE